MSSQWTWYEHGTAITGPSQTYIYGKDDEQLDERLNAMQAVVDAADGLIKSIVAGRDFDIHTGKWSIGNDELIALSEAVYPLQQKGAKYE